MNRFKKPCILDVKVGRVTYDPSATQEKIAQELAKFPPLQKVRFQFTGMKVKHTRGVMKCSSSVYIIMMLVIVFLV